MWKCIHFSADSLIHLLLLSMIRPVSSQWNYGFSTPVQKHVHDTSGMLIAQLSFALCPSS